MPSQDEVSPSLNKQETSWSTDIPPRIESRRARAKKERSGIPRRIAPTYPGEPGGTLPRGTALSQHNRLYAYSSPSCIQHAKHPEIELFA
jgi:hypothetical protein